MAHRRTIRVIPPQAYSGTLNMALDQVLLDSKETVLRFYQWSEPTLSLGFSQKSPKGCDLEFLKERGIPVIRRDTGGQAVLHDRELTYSIAAPGGLFSPSVIQTYKRISAPLVGALHRIGLDAAMEEQPRARKQTSNCFLEISNFEVAVKRKKLVGSAQVRRGPRFLQHGSILLDIDAELWQGVWRPEGGILALLERFTSIKTELGVVPQAEELARIIAECFQEEWNVNLVWKDFDRAELQRAEELEENYLYSPKKSGNIGYICA